MPLPDVSLGSSTARTAEPNRADFDEGPSMAVEDLPHNDPECDTRNSAGSLEVTDLQASDLDLPSMAGWERLVVAAGYAIRMTVDKVRQVRSRSDGLGGLHPESWSQWRARVKSRAWLPEGVRGGLPEWVPVAYYNSVGPALVVFGRGLVAVGRSAEYLGQHMSAFMVALFLVVAAVVLWLCSN